MQDLYGDYLYDRREFHDAAICKCLVWAREWGQSGVPILYKSRTAGGPQNGDPAVSWYACGAPASTTQIKLILHPPAPVLQLH